MEKYIFCKKLQVNSVDIRAKSYRADWKVAGGLSYRQHRVLMHFEWHFTVATAETVLVSVRTTQVDLTRARGKVCTKLLKY